MISLFVSHADVFAADSRHPIPALFMTVSSSHGWRVSPPSAGEEMPRLIKSGNIDFVPVSSEGGSSDRDLGWSGFAVPSDPSCESLPEVCRAASDILSRYGAKFLAIGYRSGGFFNRVIVFDQSGILDWSDFSKDERVSDWLSNTVFETRPLVFQHDQVSDQVGDLSEQNIVLPAGVSPN